MSIFSNIRNVFCCCCVKEQKITENKHFNNQDSVITNLNNSYTKNVNNIEKDLVFVDTSTYNENSYFYLTNTTIAELLKSYNHYKSNNNREEDYTYGIKGKVFRIETRSFGDAVVQQTIMFTNDIENCYSFIFNIQNTQPIKMIYTISLSKNNSDNDKAKKCLKRYISINKLRILESPKLNRLFTCIEI